MSGSSMVGNSVGAAVVSSTGPTGHCDSSSANTGKPTLQIDALSVPGTCSTQTPFAVLNTSSTARGTMHHAHGVSVAPETHCSHEPISAQSKGGWPPLVVESDEDDVCVTTTVEPCSSVMVCAGVVVVLLLLLPPPPLVLLVPMAELVLEDCVLLAIELVGLTAVLAGVVGVFALVVVVVVVVAVVAVVVVVVVVVVVGGNVGHVDAVVMLCELGD